MVIPGLSLVSENLITYAQCRKDRVTALDLPVYLLF